MKDLGEAAHILGFKLTRDHMNRNLYLAQRNYIDTVLARFSMQDSKKGHVPLAPGMFLSKEMCPKTQEEIQDMKGIPYA